MLASVATQLSTAGLIIAGVMSCTNVLMEVARKKAVTQRSLLPVMFWSHLFDALVFGLVLLVRRWHTSAITIQDAGNLFGIMGLHLAPLPTYCIYLAIDLLILSLCNWLFFRALQVSPMSTSVPFLAFTSVLLVPAAFLILRELPSAAKLLGVLLTIVGSLVMHRRLFATGLLAPVKAIFHETGSRYMLTVSLLLAISSPLDKRLVMMTGVFTQSFVYGVGMCVFFLALALSHRDPLWSVLKSGLLWIALAGILDAISLLLQYQSYHYLDVVIAVSIKRAGIVLSVLFGWLFFSERDLVNKLIATSVMFIGVVILYLPITVPQAVAAAAATLLAMLVALTLTGDKAPRRKPAESAAPR